MFWPKPEAMLMSEPLEDEEEREVPVVPRAALPVVGEREEVLTLTCEAVRLLFRLLRTEG